MLVMVIICGRQDDSNVSVCIRDKETEFTEKDSLLMLYSAQPSILDNQLTASYLHNAFMVIYATFHAMLNESSLLGQSFLISNEK